MSDIGILNDPLSLALIALLLGSPGLALERSPAAGSGCWAGFISPITCSTCPSPDWLLPHKSCQTRHK
jgi:hypothetical protein